MTLPRKLRVVAREIAIETAGHASELELAESIALEVDIGWLDHVQVVGIPKAHLGDPPLADHRALCSAPHVHSFHVQLCQIHGARLEITRCSAPAPPGATAAAGGAASPCP